MVHHAGFTIDGAVASYGKYQTPHYPQIKEFVGSDRDPTNQDYGLFVPDVGLLVADGYRPKGEFASSTVVDAVVRRARQLKLNQMPAQEAYGAVKYEILPYADQYLGNEKSRLRSNAGTTLGALLFTGEGQMVGIGAGDTAVVRCDPNFPSLEWITVEQCTGSLLHNSFEGKGRPNITEMAKHPAEICELMEDQVSLVPLVKGNTYGIVCDGFLGDKPEERMPEDFFWSALKIGGTALETAESLVRLPADLMRERVGIVKAGRLYRAKFDDLTVGVLKVG